MKYLLAVSGGVDSVVLLKLMADAGKSCIVAHVDHGVRPESDADARFVAELARHYELPYVSVRYELGAHASEASARDARYTFLREQAKLHGAVIVTAHHQADIVESIAINLHRGTGWRGLAVMSNSDVRRPLKNLRKSQLIEFALAHRLEWVEDETNVTDAYLRNRLRRQISRLLTDAQRRRIISLRENQLALREDILYELARLQMHATSRYYLSVIAQEVAEELIRAHLAAQSGYSPTRPECERILLAVKTARAGTVHQVAAGISIVFTSRKLSVKVV